MPSLRTVVLLPLFICSVLFYVAFYTYVRFDHQKVEAIFFEYEAYNDIHKKYEQFFDTVRVHIHLLRTSFLENDTSRVLMLLDQEQHAFEEFEKNIPGASHISPNDRFFFLQSRIQNHIKNFNQQLPTLKHSFENNEELSSSLIEFENQVHHVEKSIQTMEYFLDYRSGETLSKLILKNHSFLYLSLFFICAYAGLFLRSAMRLRFRVEGPAQTQEEQAYVDIIQEKSQSFQRASVELETRTKELEKTMQSYRKLEHELGEIKLYTENLVNHLKSGILVTHLSLDIVSFNRSARSFLGLSHSNMGQSLKHTILYAALVEHASENDLEQALQQHRSMSFTSVKIKKELMRLYDIHMIPYQDETGSVRGLLWVLEDVTFEVETKHQLLMSERLAAVGRLSSQVAHEIRNPLSAIGLNAEILEEEFSIQLTGESQQEALVLLKAISSEVHRLSEVTEGYLQLSRMPQPQKRLNNINNTIHDLMAMLTPEFKNNHIEIMMHLHTPAPDLFFDAAQIHQALLNILRNAREAMPEGGRLYIETSIQTMFQISIRDSGKGIEAHLQPRLCEPFFTTKRSGTGLGLSISRQILQDHGGELTIQNYSEGGAVVLLHIPLSIPAEMPQDKTLHQD